MDGGQILAEQIRRRREAASRCEPLDCGHRDPLDCTTAGCGQAPVSDETPAPEPAAVDPNAIAELWANAKAAWTTRAFPKYGAREWTALSPDDPRRLAAALEAAEMWRKFGDEEALLQWFREASRARPSIADRRTRAELDAAAKPKPPHQLRATRGWPPIAVPGRPGKYLTYRAQKAA
ncbi:hypothetical protein [Streptomyces sp. NPDC091215]|uniref:hypothetical protein n=1 Tax=Streptomyces sp. NPDC091215 TaxID=3155192 RepID=UPI0034452F82